MKKLITIVVILAVAAGSFYVFKLFEPEVWEKNEQSLKRQLINEGNGILNFANFTSFKWDEMYIFAPNTANEFIYETIGSEWGKIQDNGIEDSMQVVFLKGNEVVCYSHGTPKQNGYYITTRFATNEKYVVVNSKDLRMFFLSQEQGFVLLDYKRASMY